MRDRRSTTGIFIVATASTFSAASSVPRSANASPTYSTQLLYTIAAPTGFGGGNRPVSDFGAQLVINYAIGDGSGDMHAILLTAPGGSAIDLTPAGFTKSYAEATDGDQQVGYRVSATAVNSGLFSGPVRLRRSSL